MILFDTNVLIDYWKKPEELLKLNITPDKYAICGVVKSELLHGARTNKEIDDILHFFILSLLIRFSKLTFIYINTHSSIYDPAIA